MKRFITPMPAAENFSPIAYKIFSSSTKFSIDNLKKLRVMLVGAGAGGLTNISDRHALGGAGGGFSMLDIDVKHGDIIEIEVGAGGNPGSNTPTSQGTSLVLPGNGGDTIFKKNGEVVFMATGGKASQSTLNGFVIGSPGKGVGGSINKNGGSPGTLISPKNLPLASALGAMRGYATGGGASGTYYNTGGNGGNIDLSEFELSPANNGGSLVGAATGGGGAWGNGGVIKCYPGQYRKLIASGGGGSGGNSNTPASPPNVWTGGNERVLKSLFGADPAVINPFLDFNGRGESTELTADFFGAKTRESAPGAGTAGFIWHNSTKYPYPNIFATNASLFGGGGGAVLRIPPSLGHMYVTGGSGGIGGGGGGASTSEDLGLSASGTTCIAGAGGNGIAMVMF